MLSSANNDLSALQLVVIKTMKRLTVLQHHVICNINNVVNGTHAVAIQASLQPGRGGSHLDSGNQTGAVSGA